MIQNATVVKGNNEPQSSSKVVYDKNAPKGYSNVNSVQREDSRTSYANRSSTAAKYISGKNKLPLTTTESKTPPRSGSDSSTSVQAESAGADNAGSRWDYFKASFQDLKFSIAGRRFAPLGQSDESHPPKPQSSSSETLDYIFENLRRKPSNRDFDDGTMDLNLLDSSSSR